MTDEEMYSKYTTVLPDSELANYQRFVTAFMGRQPTAQEFRDQQYDYDLPGYYMKYVRPMYARGEVWSNEDPRNHLNDEFKKPWHPTFSNQSIYHGVDGNYGGSWQEHPTAIGKQVFFASPTNELYMSPERRQQYFRDREQGNMVIPVTR